MTIFKLERYPYVCRMCLKPEQYRKMTSLDTEDECFEEGTYYDFLATITFQVEEEKRHLFPRSVCPQCKDLLQMFARLHTKIRNVHQFMNALAKLRDFNAEPMKDLFQSKPDTVRTMLTELNLCSNGDFRVEDLINEFPQFQIAKLPTIVERNCRDEIIDIKIEEPQLLDELVEPKEESVLSEKGTLEELTKQTIDEIVASKDTAKIKVQQQKAAIQAKQCKRANAEV